MCRLLAYLGDSIRLEQLLYDPQHSLIVQSYQPREMTGGLLNADGFGVGWYSDTAASNQGASDIAASDTRPAIPHRYRHTIPIWNDINLPDLSRYIHSNCILANVRSATPGISVDLSNCQPFQHQSLMAVHNGYIDRFRKTLLRPIRERLSPTAYEAVQGTTDSEHMYGLFLDAYAATQDLQAAMRQMIKTMLELATEYRTDFSANFVVSDGRTLVATRFANRDPVPTLYWLQGEPTLPASSILIASEPFFDGAWQPFSDRSLLTVNHDLTLEMESLASWYQPAQR